MTKYLTPKVRGCPDPTAGGTGGLIQECGPPDVCQESTWLAGGCHWPPKIQSSQPAPESTRAGRAEAGNRGQASGGVSERPVRWGRARGWSAGNGVAEETSFEHVTECRVF